MNLEGGIERAVFELGPGPLEGRLFQVPCGNSHVRVKGRVIALGLDQRLQSQMIP